MKKYIGFTTSSNVASPKKAFNAEYEVYPPYFYSIPSRDIQWGSRGCEASMVQPPCCGGVT
jgi:hypothetical protein